MLYGPGAYRAFRPLSLPKWQIDQIRQAEEARQRVLRQKEERANKQKEENDSEE